MCYTFPVSSKTSLKYFFILILCVLVLSVLFFLLKKMNPSSREANGRTNVILSSEELPEVDTLEDKTIQDDRHSIIIPSKKEFSPDQSKVTVISFYFYQETPPVFNRRQKLIIHYQEDKIPYPGWAIAFRRFPSSSRFEFYVKDKNGAGGWFSFEGVHLEKNKWYAITFALKTNEFIFSLFTPLTEEMKPSGKSKKLGGFPLSGIQNVEANSKLQITSGKPRIGPFRGNIKGLSIFQLDDLPKEKIFMSHAKEGSSSLLKEYSSHCILSLLEDERAGSCKYSHP